MLQSTIKRFRSLLVERGEGTALEQDYIRAKSKIAEKQILSNIIPKTFGKSMLRGQIREGRTATRAFPTLIPKNYFKKQKIKG
jgi:hypothetical protein